MGWKLYIAESTIFARRSLRRYSGNECAVAGGRIHDAEVVIDEKFVAGSDDEATVADDKKGYAGDPRWQDACVCGYRFHPEDHWQVNVNRLYSGAPGENLHVLRELPPGGCWDAHWMDHPQYKGPDGKAWACMMPCMIEWMVYGPSSGGKPWDVQGTIPKITVSPSISISGLYHGWIKNGEISEDADGRPFAHLKRT